jgi:capsular exopolysaccharide synthesis family protein
MKKKDYIQHDYDLMNSDSTQLDENENPIKLIVRLLKIMYIHIGIFLPVMLIITGSIIWYGIRQPEAYIAEYEVFYNESMKDYSNMTKTPVILCNFDKNYWLKAMVSDDLMKHIIKETGLTYTTTQLKRKISATHFDKRKEDIIPVFKVIIRCERKELIPVLIESYITALNILLTEYQISSSERLIKYFKEQINQNNKKLDEIDLQILSLGDNFGGVELVDFSKIKGNLEEFRKELLKTKVSLSTIKAARTKTQHELKNLDGTIVNESAFSEPLKVKLMNLEVDLARSLTKHRDDHPNVKQIRKNIEQISIMLRDSIEERLEIKSMVANPLKSQLMSKLLELQISEITEITRIESLEQVIRELEQRTLPNSVNQDHQQLLRSRELIFMTLTQLNDRLIEAQSSSYGSLNRFVYINDQDTIKYANKGLSYYVLIAIFAGLVVAFLVVFTYDLLDNRIMLVSDFERLYSIPLLGTLRHYNSEELNDPYSSTGNFQSKETGNLIVSTRQFIKKHKIKSIAIASSDRKEGKSHISLKLATALASKNLKVLLVDLDFFAPRLSNTDFPETKLGLSNFLEGEVLLHDIVTTTNTEKLFFVSAGNYCGQPELFYHQQKINEFIKWGSQHYDIVIYDTPAASYIPDVYEFFDLVDSIIIVVRLRLTTRKAFDQLLKNFEHHDHAVLSTIVNDVRTGKDRGNYYNYKYSYIPEGEPTIESSADNNQTQKMKINGWAISTMLFVVVLVSGIILITYHYFPETYAKYYNLISDFFQPVVNSISNALRKS